MSRKRQHKQNTSTYKNATQPSSSDGCGLTNGNEDLLQNREGNASKMQAPTSHSGTAQNNTMQRCTLNSSQSTSQQLHRAQATEFTEHKPKTKNYTA